MTAATASAAPNRTARPARPRPPLGAWSLIAIAVVVTFVAGSAIDFTILPLFTDTGRGWFIISQFFAPDWSFLVQTIQPMSVTLATAVVATVIGTGIALVVSFLASTVSNPNAIVYRASKLIRSVGRSLPDVVWGLLFVAFVGIGALAGVLALIMFNIGIIAKLTAETIDAVDPGPLEAADASGANVVQRSRVAVLPQILPNYVSYSMYVFELNVRASVVLGFVGAGGIGTQIAVQLARFNYDNLSAIIVLLFVVVFLIDQSSGYLRRRLAR